MNIVPAPKTDPSKVDFVHKAESLLTTAVEHGDFDMGFAIINELYEQAETFTQVIGAGLDMIESAWDKFEHKESFLDAAVRKTRLNPITVRNRVNVRKFLSSGSVPKQYLEDISNLGQKSLIRLANTERSGYEIDEEDWEKFSTAVSEQQVDAIARAIEGKPPRSNFVGLYYDERFLKAYINGRMIGLYEKINPEDPDAIEGREKLIARAKILDRVEY